MIRLQTLGRIALLQEGAPVGQRLLSQPRRAALLAYLLVRSAEGPVPRDELLGIFWGDRPEREARKCLSQALHFIRQALRPGVITATRAHVAVDRTLITCDAAEVAEYAARSAFGTAAEAYAGQFLPGFTVGIPEVDQWVDGERTRIERIALRACIRAAEDHVLREDRIAAAKYALRAADIKPLDEETVSRVVRLLEEIDCGNEALDVIARHAAALEMELDEVPSPEMAAVAEAIRDRIDPPIPWSPSHLRVFGEKTVAGGSKRRMYEQIAVAVLSVVIFVLIVSSYGWRRAKDSAVAAAPTLLLIDEARHSAVPTPDGYKEVLDHTIAELSKARGMTLRLATTDSGHESAPPSGAVVIVRLTRAEAGSDSSALRALMLHPLTGEVVAVRRATWLNADPSHRRETAVKLAGTIRTDLGVALARQQGSRHGGTRFETVVKERALADSLRLSGAHTAARSLLRALEAQIANMSSSPELVQQLGSQRAAVAFDLMWLELSSPQQDRSAASAALTRGLQALDSLDNLHQDELDIMAARAKLLFWTWQTAPPESIVVAETARNEARRLLESVVARAPGRAEAWVHLSSIYETEERYTDAYRAAHFAIDTDVYAEYRMEVASRLYSIALEMADTTSARQWCSYLPRGGWARAQCELTTAFHRADIPPVELVRLRDLLASVTADSWAAPRLSLLLAATLGVSGREAEAQLLAAQYQAVTSADPEIDIFRAMAALAVADSAAARRYLHSYISGAPLKRSHVARSRTFSGLAPRAVVAAATEH